MRRPILLVSAVFGFLLSAGAGLAAKAPPDPALPKVDPPDQWHIVTGRQELPTLNTHCVGGTRSAYCVLATTLACFVSPGIPTKGLTFCSIATGDANAFTWYGIDPVHYYVPPHMIMFRILSASRVDSGGVDAAIDQPSRRPKAGDVKIRLELKECYDDFWAKSYANALYVCHVERYNHYDMFLRHSAKNWQVINYMPGKSNY